MNINASQLFIIFDSLLKLLYPDSNDQLLVSVKVYKSDFGEKCLQIE